MPGFIAVHCGAGYHKAELYPNYKKLCKKACLAATNTLNGGGTAFLACQVAVMILEHNALTNAGYGSNLTLSGEVECDASIMDGETLNFGACGAVKGVQYPITLASQICKDQTSERPLGLISPLLLVGEGAHDYAKISNLKLIENDKLISKKSYMRYKKNKALLKTHSQQRQVNNERMDTVGAVCVDHRGHVAAASSSGGVFLKYDGRVGQAAIYASGVWADSVSNKTENSVAVTTTGTGEYLMRTQLAKELAQNIKTSTFPVTAFSKTLKEDFIESRYLRNIPDKLGGALALHVSPGGHGELLWGHSTRTMGFAYMDSTEKKAIGRISELPPELEGKNTIVSGICFKINLNIS
ncbi:Taspase 1 [Carabus blaptoides fortunei]